MESPVILILDDDVRIRFNMRLFLEDEGFLCLEAENAEKALEIIEHETVHIAIVDLRLPGMNGEMFIETSYRIHPHLKFIIHTGSLNYTIPDALLMTGLKEDDIFFKPVDDMERLVKKIIAHC